MLTCPSQRWGGHLCRRATSRMRKKNRNPASKESSGLSWEGQRRPSWWGPSFLQQTWIEQVTLDRSMAATGGEAASRWSLWIWITLDSSGRRGQRGGKGGDGKEEKKSPKPGPTSMVVSWVGRSKARPAAMMVSWTWRFFKTPTRVVIEGRGLQARANLNGGESWPRSRSSEMKEVKRMWHGCKEENKGSCSALGPS